MTTPETYLASQPQHYIAYSPRGAGLECAVVYFVQGEDVYGWWIGFRDYAYPSAYFKLERFFSPGSSPLYATEGGDVYGGWRYLYSQREPKLPRPIAIDDEICHKLEQLQDGFANEWLWFSGQPGSATEVANYARDELAVEEVNLRHRHLGKLRKEAPVWTHASHDLSLDITDYLAQRWPLSYRRT
jgi:hypothetical protein